MHDKLMRTAAGMAVDNVQKGIGGPFAAIIVRGGQIVGRGTNRVTSSNDPTAHAEVLAIRDACRTLESFRLDGCYLYTTCEPCPMCLGAIYWARIERVYFGATQEDARAAGFDDEHIYREIARPISERRLEMHQIGEENARSAFRAWVDSEDRIPY